jgi:heat shock protein HslJ
MNLRPFLGTALLAAIVLSACSPAPSSTPESSASVPADLSSLLRGTGWTAISIAGVAVVPAHEPTIEFDDVGVRGSTGCNEWGGLPTFGANGALSINEISMTKRACAENDAAGQEAAFMGALRGAAFIRFADRRLTIGGAGGDVVFVPGIGLGG